MPFFVLTVEDVFFFLFLFRVRVLLLSGRNHMVGAKLTMEEGCTGSPDYLPTSTI